MCHLPRVAAWLLCLVSATVTTGRHISPQEPAFKPALSKGHAGVYAFDGRPKTVKTALPRVPRVHCSDADNALECAALVDLATGTVSKHWVFNKNWLSNVSICAWELVGCDASGRVKVLALSFNNMTGSLPASLGGLTELEDFDIEGNHISGSFPAILGADLTNLVELGIGSNNFKGQAPDSLCTLRAARGPACDASGNQWACPLPPCLARNCGATCT